MLDFLLNYALFFAKVATIVFSILIIVAFVAHSVGAKHKSSTNLNIEHINDKFEEYVDALTEVILDKDEKKARLKQLKKDKKAKQKEHKDSSEPTKHRMYVVRFDGDLHASEVEHLREAITAILSFASKDDEVLVVIESPGGVVHSYGLAASQLARIRDKGLKLTVAVDLVAASGGYMMACVANEIIAAPFAVVGSIGVVAQVPNFNKLLTKHDVEIEHHTAGEYKSTLTMLAKNTNKGREKFKQELEEIRVLFKDHVAKFRPVLNVDQVATGEAWFATQALDLNLIDKISTSDDFLMQAKDNFEIYELTVEEHYSIKDKISGLISYKSLVKVCEKIYYSLAKTNSKIGV